MAARRSAAGPSKAVTFDTRLRRRRERYDCYCALCGGPFYWEDLIVDSDGSPAKPGDYYWFALLDRMLITLRNPNVLAWLKDLRLVTRSEDALGEKKCYLSGIGQLDEGNNEDVMCTVPARDDPNVSASSGQQSQNCPALHSRMLPKRKTLEFDLDLDLVHHIMIQHTDIIEHPERFCLGFDLLELEKVSRRAFFECHVGLEPYLSDPLQIPSMNSFLANLPLLPVGVAEEPIAKPAALSNEVATPKPLGALPVEVLLTIFCLVPVESTIAFCLASRTCWDICQTNKHWLHRLLFQMPWVWEFKDANKLRVEQNEGHLLDRVDWQGVYRIMRTHSFLPIPFDDSPCYHTVKVPRHARLDDRALPYSDGWDDRWLRTTFQGDDEVMQRIALELREIRVKHTATKQRKGFDRGLIGLSNRRRIWQIAEEFVEPYRALQMPEAVNEDEEERRIELGLNRT
ncbi:hypothetical protein BU16DRAFT_532880 [Lophium mytilinum]|uniref:F-box domain-containing protein n=1 Tax=Lophium mytilinum TaxID=390894 RepID=A0A6A6RDQ9_9PEZI|nr:hypothetical protein BU16DRAFT_532880 [Lophium mytilinum]